LHDTDFGNMSGINVNVKFRLCLGSDTEFYSLVPIGKALQAVM